MARQKKSDDDLFFKQIIWNLDYSSKHYNPKKKWRQNIFCWKFNNIVKTEIVILKLEVLQKKFHQKNPNDNHQTNFHVCYKTLWFSQRKANEKCEEAEGLIIQTKYLKSINH